MSLTGPVGFQSNNVPLTAGMFTSIGACVQPAPAALVLWGWLWGSAKGPQLSARGWDGVEVLPGLRMCWALSPEPGYYQDGEFGIRIEDIVLVVEAQTKVLLYPFQDSAWGWGARAR